MKNEEEKSTLGLPCRICGRSCPSMTREEAETYCIKKIPPQFRKAARLVLRIADSGELYSAPYSGSLDNRIKKPPA